VSLTAIFTKQRPVIGGYVFDATLEESDELVTDVTQFPVENGDVANDHANNRNPRIFMRVGLSDNPFRALSAQASQQSVVDRITELGIPVEAVRSAAGIGASVATGGVIGSLNTGAAVFAGVAASIGNAAFAAGQDQTRSTQALSVIRELQRNKTVITIATSKAVYENVLITRTARTTNPRNERGLILDVEMEQLRIFKTFDITLDIGVPAPNDTAAAQAFPLRDYGEIVGEDI